MRDSNFYARRVFRLRARQGAALVRQLRQLEELMIAFQAGNMSEEVVVDVLTLDLCLPPEYAATFIRQGKEGNEVHQNQ